MYIYTYIHEIIDYKNLCSSIHSGVTQSILLNTPYMVGPRCQEEKDKQDGKNSCLGVAHILMEW